MTGYVEDPMAWRRVTQSHRVALALADRHYSRNKPGSHTMMPPGRQVVLITLDERAVWGLSWPRGEGLSSALIRSAVSASRYVFGDPPPDGLVTIIDPDKIRHKRDPGRCFLRAGFRFAGSTW